jgi:4-amino-4-deoxy-L-arabinose transferase-like glycosyltransferase
MAKSRSEKLRSSEKFTERFGERTGKSQNLTSNQKLFFYACLVPIFGIIPSAIALASQKQGKAIKDTAKVSLVMAMLWFLSYSTVGTGQDISQGLYQGTFTSLYFLASFGLMVRLLQKKSVSFPWGDRAATKK